MSTHKTGYRWFSEILRSWAMDESSLSIGRVKQPTIIHNHHPSTHMLLVAIFFQNRLTDTLTYCYLSDTTQEELSNEFLRKRVEIISNMFAVLHVRPM